MSGAPTQLLTVDDVAEYLGLTNQSVYNLMKRGMPSYKVGRCRRFRLEQVDAWLDAAQRVAPEADVDLEKAS